MPEPWKFIEKNCPPPGMVRYLKSSLGVGDVIDGGDPSLVFCVLSAASFVNWMKHTNGTLWLHRVYGVGHESPGPFDIFRIKEAGKSVTLDPARVWIWSKLSPDRHTGDAPKTSSDWVSTHVGNYISHVSITESMLGAAGLSEADFENKETVQRARNQFFRAVGALCARWIMSEEGGCWAAPDGSVISAVKKMRGERLYSYSHPQKGILPILEPAVVEHAKEGAENSCEDCGVFMPCTKKLNGAWACAYCAAYLSQDFSKHDLCERCDLSDCSHWSEFRGEYNSKGWII